MGIAGSIVVFVIVWWIVFFASLPWGVERGGDPNAGEEPGAPANPRLWLKAAITTIIAIVLWAAIYYIVDADIIRFGPQR
jgi:predicted secreted protein